jgi:hypothetical protein
MKALLKIAKISTQAEREKSRQWRMKNKEKAKRYAKRIKRQIKQGVRIPMKRVGSAAGGYSFVAQGKQVKPSQGSSASHSGSSKVNFDPLKNTGSTQVFYRLR